MAEQKFGRRKEDQLTAVESLYSVPIIKEKEDGSIEVEKKFSLKKTIISSLVGLLASSLIAWGTWVTNGVYNHNTNSEVICERVSTAEKAISFEVNERKTAINKVMVEQAKDREVLHKRISRLDTEINSRMNGLDTKIESARLSIGEKVAEVKDTLGEKMDRQTALMMQLLQQAYDVELKKSSGD